MKFGDIIFFLQVVITSKAWMLLPPALRPDINTLFNLLLSSRADSTVKKYTNEINKFFLWCRSRQIPLQIPFSSSVVALYLFDLDQQLRSPATMVLVHAALKWLHSFVPDDGPNPLDNACCKNMIQCAKRTRSHPVNINSAFIGSSSLTTPPLWIIICISVLPFCPMLPYQFEHFVKMHLY